MANRFLNNITINDEYTLPSSDGTENQIIVTDGAGNLSFNDLGTVTGAVTGVESNLTYYEVKNSSGAQILKGKGVMAVGTDGNSGHILIDEMVADGSVEARYFLGVLSETLNNGDIGRVIAFGELDQFNTTGQNGETWTNGQVLWCDPDSAGDFTITEPDGPNVKIPAAFILKASTNGKIQVRVQANEGLHQLHDTKIASQVDGDVLVWDNTTGVWINDSTLNIDYTNGNVGIGTTSPAFKTTIYSDSNTDSFPLVVGQPNNANEFVGIGLSGFVASNGAVKAGFVLDRKNTYGVGDIHILNNTTTDNSNATLADSKFTILQNGNVGIGTISPSQKLDVDGKIRARSWFTGVDDTNTLYSSNSTGVYIQGSSYTGTGSVISFRRTDGNIKAVVNTETGNVGIGTTSPTHLLTLETASSPGLKIKDTTQGATLIAYSQDSNSHVGTLSSHPLIFDTNSTERMRIDTSGNVGIGTTSPARKLEVNGEIQGTNLYAETYRSSRSDGDIYIQAATSTDFVSIGTQVSPNLMRIDGGGNVGIGTNNPGHKLNVSSPNNTTAVGIDIGGYASFDFGANSTSGYSTLFYMDDVGLDIGHNSNGRSINFKTGGTDKLTILGNGNVGIGTTSPARKLDIKVSTLNDDGIVIRDENGNIRTDFTLAGAAGVREGRIKLFDNSGNANVQIHSDTVSYFNGGNVGIGTTSPSYSLSVNGAIQTDILRGYTYPTTSYLDFDDDNLPNANSTSLTSVSNMAFVIDSNNNSTTDAFYWKVDGTTSTGSTIMTLADEGALQLNNYGSGTFTGTATQRLGVDSSGNVIEIPIGSGAVDGSGTANYIPKWTDSDTLGDSLISQSGSIVDINGTIRYDKQIASNFTSGAKAFIAISSGGGAAKYKVYKNTNTTDGYARFKLDRAYDYGSNDQMVQEAIYQRRTTTKNVRFRYDGDITTVDDSYLEFYELTDGTVEGWICVDDYSKCFAEIYYDADTSETYPNPSSGTPTGTLIHSTNPDTSTPNWDSYQGNGYFSGNVGIGTSSPSGRLTIGSGTTADDSTMFNVNGRYNDVGFNGGASGLLNQGVWSFINSATWDQTRFYVQDQNNSDSRLTFDFKGNAGNTNILAGTSSGKVGIGTTNPSYTLDVNGEGNFSNYVNVNSSTGIRSTGWIHLHRYASSLNVSVGNNGSDVNLYVPNGNVGIGTTSPDGKLDVDVTGNNRVLRLSRDTGTNGRFDIDFESALTNLESLSSFVFKLGSSPTERMRLTGTGLGIGTASPLNPLQVDGAIAAQRSGVEGVYARRELTGSGHELDVPSGYHSLLVKNNGSEQLRITSAGFVGIGTTNPGYKLDVDGGAGVPLRLYSSADAQLMINSPNSWTGIGFNDGAASGTDYIWHNGVNQTFAIGGGGSNVSGKKLHVHGATTIGTGLAGTAVPTNGLLVEGNVGIGTPSPGVKLHLYQGGLSNDTGVTDMLKIELNRSDHSTLPSGPAILFKDQDTNNLTNEARIKMMTVNDTDFGDNDEAASNLLFETTNNGVASDKMIITGRGNVGIGTINPSYTLDVNGALHSINITLADGIYHEGDTNTYMQFHGADQWRVVTGGAERLEVNNSAISSTIDNIINSNGTAEYYIANISNSSVASTNHSGFKLTELGTDRFGIYYTRDGLGKVRFENYGTQTFEWIRNGTTILDLNTSNNFDFKAGMTVRGGINNRIAQDNYIHTWTNESESNFAIRMYNDGTNNGTSVPAFRFGLEYGSTQNAAVLFYRGGGSTGGFLGFTTSTGVERLRIQASGNVSIGNTNDSYKLDVSGTGRFTSTVTATNFVLSSDISQKQNVQDLKARKINVNWKSYEFIKESGDYRVGVIAQELEQTHPEFVVTDKKGIKSVKYIDLLIAKIAELENEIKELKNA